MLSDAEIAALLSEPKTLPEHWGSKLKTKPKDHMQHGERALEIDRSAGGTFRIIVRQNHVNFMDFSIVLVYSAKDGKEYRLRRYNGKHPSAHTNRLEKRAGIEPAYFRNVCHIHTATERYQQAGLEIDSFAEPTDKYLDLASALSVFIVDHSFAEAQHESPLFGTGRSNERD